jgi:hypothetical protein
MVSNVLGEIVYSTEIANKAAINLGAQPNGTYTIHLSSADAMTVEKVVIAH